MTYLIIALIIATIGIGISFYILSQEKSKNV